MKRKATLDLVLVCTLIFIMLLGGCSYFEQNNFVVSETLLTDTEEHIFYHVYQTGVDNYRVEFLATYGTDTTKLFEYYLNDAVYTTMRFSSAKIDDTLKIRINFPSENIVANTENQTVVLLTSE